MNKVVAIIQARMGSTRLPSKVLMDINGRPMLQRVIDRVNQSQLVNDIVIVTTKKSSDRPIVDLGMKNDISVYVGKEFDVLDRYYCATVAYNIDTIVRITSDCPLIDPKVIDKSIKYFLNNGFDYVTNTGYYPDGLDTEVFSHNTLTRTWMEATAPYDREHVTSYICRYPKIFKIGKVRKHRTKLPNYRWSVDTVKDLEFVRWVYRELGDKFHLNDIIKLLEWRRDYELLPKIVKTVR